MVKPITLYTAAAGLNTVLDPQRLLYGVQDNPGLIELSQALNVSIDERGLVELRKGYTQLASGTYHSLFCDDGSCDCFVVQERSDDAAIFRVDAGLTLTVVRTGLTKGLRMAWGQSNTDTFYSNGVERGFIRNGISNEWPVGVYTGPDDDRGFAASAPIANHIAFLQGGMLLLAVGPAIFINHAPFQYGLFNLRSGYIGFQSDVLMVAPIKSGAFVSDCERTWFFRKMDGWYSFKQELVAEYPAFLGSLAHQKVKLSKIGLDTPGFGRVWAGPRGICIGTETGQMIDLTEDKVVYPSGYSSGACLVHGDTIIHTASSN